MYLRDVYLYDGQMMVDVPWAATIYNLDGTQPPESERSRDRVACEYRGTRVHKKQEMIMFRFPGERVTLMYRATHDAH